MMFDMSDFVAVTSPVVRPNPDTPSRSPNRSWRGDAIAVGLLLVMIVLIWLPRLRGPIDLRWDAAVYYTTGTAIYEGKGYRLLSEPGEALAVQYPPLLPTVVAAVQWACGTSDYLVVGPWLRIIYAGVYALYVLGSYALARRLFAPWIAFSIALLVALNFQTIFMSDLLFSEIPFAVCVLGLILLNRYSDRAGGVVGQALCAWAAFLFRSAGLALLVAWVGDSLMRRKWKQAALRALLAAVPFVAWQGYVASVQRSPGYVQPAYEFQRAAYQYYNVPYAENLKLTDPFAPELGRTTKAELVKRVVVQTPDIVRGFGQAMLSSPSHWRGAANKAAKSLGIPPQPRIVARATQAIVWVLGVGVAVGIVVLLWQREWLIGLFIITAAGLTATTPWPAQFGRYLSPTTPLLLIALATAMTWLWQRVRRTQPTTVYADQTPRRQPLLAIALAGVLLVHGVVVLDMYRPFVKAALGRGATGATDGQLFYAGEDWRMYDDAVAWVKANVPADAIVVTGAPQWLYMKTGRKAVMPPMIIDATDAARLIAGVPATYAIDDQVDIGSVTSRYLRPALAYDRAQWETVYTATDGKTMVLKHVERTTPAATRATSMPSQR